MTQNTTQKKNYRRYGSTSLQFAQNPHDRKPFEPSLVFMLEGLDFKGRVESLRNLIAHAVSKCHRNYNDEYTSRLVAVFARALADRGWEEFLRPVEGRPGEYEFEDTEFLGGFCPLSGRHRSVAPELIKLYASLPPVLEYVGESKVVGMPLTKGKILESLVHCLRQNYQDFDDLIVFLLNYSNSKGILEDEMKMWKIHLKNAMTYVPEGMLVRHAERVAKWPVYTAFREELLRFILMARLRKLNWKQLSMMAVPESTPVV